AGAIDDRGLFLGDRYLLGGAEHVEGDVLELDTEILADRGAAGQDGDVLQHGLAAITEARRLHRRDLQAATPLVDHEGGQRLAFHVLGDDQQRTRRLHHRLQHRQHGLQVGELLLVDQDVGILELGAHLVGVGHEVGGEVAAVELHALDHLELGLEALGFLDGDDAFVADLLHRLGDHLADGGVTIGGDGAHLGDLFRLGDVARARAQIFDNCRHGRVDTALQVHRVHAGGDGLDAFAHDRLGQHGCGGGADARQVVGLGGNLGDHLGAHVLELVGQLDILGDSYTVLGNAGRTEGLLQDDVTALGTQGDLHRIGEDVHAAQHALTRVLGKLYLFSCHLFLNLLNHAALVEAEPASSTPMMSDSFMIKSSSPSILTSVPDHLPKITRSPALTSSATSSPFSLRRPGPTATTSPC